MIEPIDARSASTTPAQNPAPSLQEQQDAAFARGDYSTYYSLNQSPVAAEPVYDPSHPTPSPSPGASPTPPASSDEAARWTPESEEQVKAYIRQAMERHGGNVEQAFSDLRDQRQKPENYYDTNLAIAADYLRARWDVQQHGAAAEALQVESYLAMKRTVGVPKEGPGPVSPYSDLEAKYMRMGVTDEARHQSFWDDVKWAIPVGGVPLGVAKAGFDLLRGLF